LYCIKWIRPYIINIRITGFGIMSKSVIILSLLLSAAPASAQWTEPVRIGIPGAYHYPQILAVGDTLHVVGTNIPGGGNSHVLSDTINSTNAMFVRIVKHGQQVMVLWRSIMNSGPRPWNIGYALSTNNGDTWTGPLYISNPGWDHILYFSASGGGPIINVILSSRIDHDLIFFKIRSTNFGQNWSQPVELFRAAQGGRPDQTTVGNIVHYIWSGRYTMDDKVEIFYTRSTNNGISWSSSYALSDSDQYHSQLPAIAADDYGNVAVTWMDFKYAPPGATGDIFIRQSADSGSNWTAEYQLTFNHYASGSDVILDMDTIHVVWEDESQSVFHRRVYYINSTDSGANWSQPYWVDGTDDDSWNPAVAASNGKVYVVWAEYRLDSGYGLYFSRYQYQTGIIENEPMTPRLGLLNAYPNPFNSKAIITYKDLKGGEIEIYNINGQKVRAFKTAEIKEGQIEWDARDALGNKVSSGIYFARARGGRDNITIKLVYLR
jgi:hypothetical protein